MNDFADSTRSASARRPGIMLVVAAVIALEIVALAVAGILAVVSLAHGGNPGIDIFLAVFSWGIALLLFGAVRAVWRGQRWGRSPMVTWQLFQIVIAVTWLQSETAPGAVALLVAAIVVVGGLLTPAVVAHISGPRPAPEV